MKSTTPASKIKSEFSLQNATNFGGVKIFLVYLEKIKLAQSMCSFSGSKALNSIFPIHLILLYLIVGWMLGCERIFHFRKLQHDALVIRFLGGRCPHHSLLYKELGRLGRSCPQLATELWTLNHEIIRPCLPFDIIDLDSTVETVYGDQVGAAKGTNPHKPERKSYHPLLAFEGQTRLNLNAPYSGQATRILPPTLRDSCSKPSSFSASGK